MVATSALLLQCTVAVQDFWPEDTSFRVSFPEVHQCIECASMNHGIVVQPH